MEYLQYYEEVYKEFQKVHPKGPQLFHSTLQDFYLKTAFPQIVGRFPSGARILEVGCGVGSLFFTLKEKLHHITAIDISETAIQLAWKNSCSPNIVYEALDSRSLSYKNEFQVVWDSHLFHCLIGLEDRKKTLQSYYRSLEKGGLIYLETIISHSQLAFTEPYYYFEDEQILYKAHGDAKKMDLIPQKMIRRSHEIEEEILSVGFKINYLFAFPNIRMIVDNRNTDPTIEDPILLRLVAEKI